MEKTFTVNVVAADVASNMSSRGVPKIFKDFQSLRDMVKAMRTNEEYSMNISWLENARFVRAKLNQSQRDTLQKEGEMWVDKLKLLEPTWWMRILEEFPSLRFGMWK